LAFLQGGGGALPEPITRNFLALKYWGEKENISLLLWLCFGINTRTKNRGLDEVRANEHVC